jgi:hypothetical protein
LIRSDDNIWKFPGKNRASAIYTAFVGGFGRLSGSARRPEMLATLLL